MANTVNNPSGGSVDGGGARPFDWGNIKFETEATFPRELGKPNTIKLDPKETAGFLQSQKDLLEIEKNKQLLLSTNKSEPLTAEDKFYESLGIKKTDGSGWGLQSRPMGRILVAVVLVAGYFAYKKFKK
jgi:hypothetical protein